jgi:hypothetical protein
LSVTVKQLENEKSSKERRRRWLAKGSVRGVRKSVSSLPAVGQIKRYILTSAQNNTKVWEPAWESLKALAAHYHAEIMVGTFSYDQNQFGEMSVKRGKDKPAESEMWYDARIEPFIQDRRIELGKGLVWCGEMNILPTQMDPLASLESYTARRSAIFPHAKMAMRSVPAMLGESAKLNYTTGTVTQRNYVQKRAGLIAEHHHVYGALLVEVNHKGNWWVRQLNADKRGRVQDLDVIADGGKVATGNHVEAINWGDLHSTWIDSEVKRASMDMLDALRPRFQFLHDVLEGAAINRHVIKSGAQNCGHYTFYRWLRGLHRVDEEFRQSVEVVKEYLRPWCKAVSPDSNHDGWWLKSWLARYDYRVDPANSELFLDLQKRFYAEIRAGKMPRDVNMMQYTFEKFGLKGVRFLQPDESFKICGARIECGMHGHLGPGGTRGTPDRLAKMGRKANTGHTHTAGIFDGLYVAGTSTRLKWDYNWGPSAWTHSHIVTYPNGKRTIVTMFAGKWRA